ncbi:MAG: hypothetical protein IPL39_12550 [Opitutaceae bacterium]|nr:hypothetical protein [Opitutaceae bacterium]
MKHPAIFRTIALIHIALGSLVLFGFALMSFAVLGAEKGDLSLLGIEMIVVPTVVAGGLLYAAVAHLKNPNRKSALALAANSSVIIWLTISGVLRAFRREDSHSPVYFLSALVLASLIYRMLLKPSALRAFPEESPNRVAGGS